MEKNKLKNNNKLTLRMLGLNPRALGINLRLLDTDPEKFFKNYYSLIRNPAKEAEKNRKGVKPPKIRVQSRIA
jgi:hypothetical protein